MTETIHRCNFCGLSENDQSILPMDFMGKEEDYHICGKCVNVVSNILFEVSRISMRNPRDTTHNGQNGLLNIVKEMINSEVCKL